MSALAYAAVGGLCRIVFWISGRAGPISRASLWSLIFNILVRRQRLGSKVARSVAILKGLSPVSCWRLDSTRCRPTALNSNLSLQNRRQQCNAEIGAALWAFGGRCSCRRNARDKPLDPYQTRYFIVAAKGEIRQLETHPNIAAEFLVKSPMHLVVGVACRLPRS